jgi:hypothetical protein
MPEAYVTEESLSPAEREAWNYCGRACEQIKSARSWLIDHLSSIGINVEERWQKILAKSDDPERLIMLTKIMRGMEPFTVYSEMIDEGHALCAHVQKLDDIATNALRTLATNSYENPFIAMNANVPDKVHEFLRVCSLYLTGQYLASTHGFDANPRRAVIDAALKILRKCKEDFAAELPENTPMQVGEKIKAAARAIDKAIASMEQVSAEPEKPARRERV